MNTVLITGSNRGIGFEFCRQYAEDGWNVIATCRCPDAASDLRALAKRYRNIRIEPVDIGDFAQIDALSARLDNEPVDVLLNNAGVYLDQANRGFGNLAYEAWSSSFLINTIAPIKLVEALLPNIQRSEKKLVVNISSLMGSMADNQSGGSLFYRSSKAGLNAAMKSLSIDLLPKGIGVLILHPGWVKTDMGGRNALIEADESVKAMKQRIEGFCLTQSGGFFKYDGSPLPW